MRKSVSVREMCEKESECESVYVRETESMRKSVKSESVRV